MPNFFATKFPTELSRARAIAAARWISRSSLTRPVSLGSTRRYDDAFPSADFGINIRYGKWNPFSGAAGTSIRDLPLLAGDGDVGSTAYEAVNASKYKNVAFVREFIRPNENKISDGWRGDAWLPVEDGISWKTRTRRGRRFAASHG